VINIGDKIEQQISFLQKELMELKPRVSRLESREYAKNNLIKIIDKELVGLKKEREEIIKKNQDTERNVGEIMMCNKLKNLIM